MDKDNVERLTMIMEKRNKYDSLTYKIIGAAIKVHGTLGNGFAEVVYADALEKEFIKEAIPYEREKEIDIIYDGEVLQHKFRADYVCYGNIILELKASTDIIGGHRAQVLNYLKATGYECGIILNFGRSRLEKERIFN